MAIVGKYMHARNFEISKFRARACVLSPSPKLETTRSLFLEPRCLKFSYLENLAVPI